MLFVINFQLIHFCKIFSGTLTLKSHTIFKYDNLIIYQIEAEILCFTIGKCRCGKSIRQVPDTGTRILDNIRPFWRSSIVCFWMPPARSKERKYHISGQYWNT